MQMHILSVLLCYECRQNSVPWIKSLCTAETWPMIFLLYAHLNRISYLVRRRVASSQLVMLQTSTADLIWAVAGQESLVGARIWPIEQTPTERPISENHMCWCRLSFAYGYGLGTEPSVLSGGASSSGCSSSRSNECKCSNTQQTPCTEYVFCSQFYFIGTELIPHLRLTSRML